MDGTYTFGSQDSINCGAWLFLNSNAPQCAVVKDSLFVPLLSKDSFQLVFSLSSIMGDTIQLSVHSAYSGTLSWSSTGNGTWFVDSVNNTAWYIPDFGEKSAGSTQITVTRAGFCRNDSDTRIIQFTPSSYRNIAGPTQFKAYPNPVQSTLHIEWEQEATFVESLLTDVHGKTIMRRLVKEETAQLDLDLQELATGFYFLHMIDGSGNHSVLKIVKE